MKGLEAILLVLGLLILSSILLAIPTMLLWNYVMPSIFGLTSINLYQAMGVNFLANILFKSNVTIKRDNNGN